MYFSQCNFFSLASSCVHIKYSVTIQNFILIRDNFPFNLTPSKKRGIGRSTETERDRGGNNSPAHPHRQSVFVVLIWYHTWHPILSYWLCNSAPGSKQMPGPMAVCEMVMELNLLIRVNGHNISIVFFLTDWHQFFRDKLFSKLLFTICDSSGMLRFIYMSETRFLFITFWFQPWIELFKKQKKQNIMLSKKHRKNNCSQPRQFPVKHVGSAKLLTGSKLLIVFFVAHNVIMWTPATFNLRPNYLVHGPENSTQCILQKHMQTKRKACFCIWFKGWHGTHISRAWENRARPEPDRHFVFSVWTRHEPSTSKRSLQ